MQIAPTAFLTYMSGKQVRLVLNESQVHSTNTIHNININSKMSLALKRALISSFYCSITQLSIELIGRSYGGGVLKLEIRETDNILLPDIFSADEKTIIKLSNFSKTINKELREGELSLKTIENIDEIILTGMMGLSEQKCLQIRDELSYLRHIRTVNHPAQKDQD
jgi:hypothetical protein